MPEAKNKGGILAVDPEAQKYIRDVTKPYVEEMVLLLANIARSETVGPRDRMKAAVRVIDYHARGGSEIDAGGDMANPSVVVVLNSENMRDVDLASDELRRLHRLTMTSTKQ